MHPKQTTLKAHVHFTGACLPPPNTLKTGTTKCYSPWLRQLADSVLRHDHGQVASLLKAIPTCQDPNTLLTDPRGTTLLHLACAFNKHRCVAALVSHASVNVNLPDIESQWTPLHRALYSGNLRAANHLLLHPQVDLNPIDAHGHTPLHLLHHLTLPPLALTAPTDLFSWGSNANYVLGHGHSTLDSSAASVANAPDPPPQPKRTSFRPHDNLTTCVYTNEFAGMPTITHLSVAKYHACMLTHDPTTNQGQLYMWGYASGGRLGSTSTSAIVKPTLAHFDGGTPTFTAVAAAHNHTLAITSLGTVWVWGSNQFGQCGLSLDSADVAALAKGYPKAYIGGSSGRSTTSANTHIAPRPLTTGHLKREPMAPNGGVAASKIHSCMWTCASLVTFGLNVGQLGHGRDSIVVQPRKVASLPVDDRIVDVKCTERFTLVLLDSGAAFVLQDYTTRRLKLAPVAGIRTSELGKAAGWSQAAPLRPPAVRKVCAVDSGGVSFGAVVTVQGHVCAWSVLGSALPPPVPGSTSAGTSSGTGESADHLHDERKKVKSALKWTPPKYVWTATGALRGAGEAVDVAIGLDGALAVVTEFGSKYALRSSWAAGKMPNWSLFALDRVTHVFANGHGSWFALRSNAVVAVPKDATDDERAREWHRPGRDEDVEEMPDKVALVSAEGTQHVVHTRLVLDFDWFQTALSSSWTLSSLSDSAMPTISLANFSSSTLSAFHTWLQSRTFSLTYPALLSLLALADFLLLDQLKAQLAFVLAQCASPHNLVDLVNTSLDVNAKHLQRACARLVVANFAYLAKKHAIGNEAWDRAVAVAEHVCKEEQDAFAPLCNGWKRAVHRPVAVAKMAGWNWYLPVVSSGSGAAVTLDKVEVPTAAVRDEESQVVQDENARQQVQPKALPVTPKHQVQPSLPSTALPSPPPPPLFTPVAVKKVSLAQIQAQEEAKKRLRRGPPASDASPSASSSAATRPATAPATAPASIGLAASPVPIRLANVSQKERKRQSKGAGTSEPIVAQAPWAPPSASSSSSPAIAPAAGGGGAASPWSKASTPAASSSSAAGPSALWPSLANVTTPLPTSPVAASSSFAAIQKEQLQAKSTKHQQVKKALAEIQIEEAAMAQLMDRFRARRGAGLVSGEMMTVVVVPR